MASISNDPNGRRRILFINSDGLRKTIRLGKIPLRYAEAVKTKVEDLVSASITGHAPADETSRWLAGLDAVLNRKLVKVGLTRHESRSRLASSRAAISTVAPTSRRRRSAIWSRPAHTCWSTSTLADQCDPSPRVMPRIFGST